MHASNDNVQHRTGFALVQQDLENDHIVLIASPHRFLGSMFTLEDPIEMVHEKFNQIAMQPKIGLTFGSALKQFGHPDVVMVGEIGDADTASNVVQAAMTGHLSLTIHTGEQRVQYPNARFGCDAILLSGVVLGCAPAFGS